jgi:hypothetical protein
MFESFGFAVLSGLGCLSFYLSPTQNICLLPISNAEYLPFLPIPHVEYLPFANACMT